MTTLDWTSPADVRWSSDMTGGQTVAAGDDARSRAFATMREAVRFVMDDLAASPTMMVGVYPKQGSALVGLAEIEQAYRSDTDQRAGEPG